MTTAVRERPIMFTGDSVPLIINGTKTQTRRVMKPQLEEFVEGPLVHARCHPAPYYDAYNGGPGWCWWTSDDRQGSGWRNCPYGRPGDSLWVRETWCPLLDPDHFADPSLPRDAIVYGRKNGAAYKASSADDDSERCRRELGYKWRSPMRMNRWASRLNLELTKVRVERLQEISEEDAKAEGAPLGVLPGVGPKRYRWGYRHLWNSLNLKRGFAWDTNPWVWVLDFKRVEGA